MRCSSAIVSDGEPSGASGGLGVVGTGDGVSSGELDMIGICAVDASQLGQKSFRKSNLVLPDFRNKPRLQDFSLW